MSFEKLGELATAQGNLPEAAPAGLATANNATEIDAGTITVRLLT